MVICFGPKRHSFSNMKSETTQCTKNSEFTCGTFSPFQCCQNLNCRPSDCQSIALSIRPPHAALVILLIVIACRIDNFTGKENHICRTLITIDHCIIHKKNFFMLNGIQLNWCKFTKMLICYNFFPQKCS